MESLKQRMQTRDEPPPPPAQAQAKAATTVAARVRPWLTSLDGPNDIASTSAVSATGVRVRSQGDAGRGRGFRLHHAVSADDATFCETVMFVEQTTALRLNRCGLHAHRPRLLGHGDAGSFPDRAGRLRHRLKRPRRIAGTRRLVDDTAGATAILLAKGAACVVFTARPGWKTHWLARASASPRNGLKSSL